MSIKKILLPFASVFLIWQTHDMLKDIEKMRGESIVNLLFIGWLISLYITGIFAFIGFAYSTQKILHDAWLRKHKD
jgi:hypothetical protein